MRLPFIVSLNSLMHDRSKDSTSTLYDYADTELYDYTDADFTGTVVRENRHSTSEYILMLSNEAISWSLKCQSTVSTFSTKAKYIGQFNAAQEAVWICLFLEKLDFRNLIQKPTILYTDSDEAWALSQDPTLHSKIKHMKIKYYWQHQQIEHEILHFNDILSKDNITNSLTKSLSKQEFKKFRMQLNLSNS